MKVSANPRQLQGSSASRRLRRAGRVPGIVYGAGKDATAIDMDHNTLFHALRVEAFQSSILDMDIGGKAEKVVLRDVQWHPYKRLVMHADFQRVLANEKMTLSVPLHFNGEEDSPAVKLNNGIINHVMTEIQVSCLPADLPEYISIDMSEADLDTSVHVSDLKMPANVEAVVTEGTDPVVATVSVKVVKEEPTDDVAAPEADADAPADDKPADEGES
ncbi:MAG: 50S ribosomal protein L25/general stress protein Ctc [Burkholderiaceae bacterium]